MRGYSFIFNANRKSTVLRDSLQCSVQDIVNPNSLEMMIMTSYNSIEKVSWFSHSKDFEYVNITMALFQELSTLN